MTRSQNQKDTAYIVAIVVLVCIIASIALYRSSSPESPEASNVSTPSTTQTDASIEETKETPQPQVEIEPEAVSTEPQQTNSAEVSVDQTTKWQRKLDQTTQALLKAEKKVKVAQHQLNEIVEQAEADTTSDVEPKATSAIKNLLYWQNEVERLQYEQENIKEKLR